MRFEIDHLTRYEYSRAVFLEPHTFRLRPRSDSFQRLIRYRLEVKPMPAVLSETLDAEGNAVAHAWFSDSTESLEVRVATEAETLKENPFDYLLMDQALNPLPLRYRQAEIQILAACLDSPPGEDEPVARFARSVANGVNSQLLPFLSELSRQLHEQIEVPIRELGEPMPAERTLHERRGACRDVTVLFMACCRSLGIAARFVSGYQQGGEKGGPSYMHAWAEVYIPGGGWRGYDPTHGLAIADSHIAVAASARPELAAPTSGSFRGTGVSSRMHTELAILTSARGSSRSAG
jgi:transglutaminase-like putative cysteine protease